jgi:hypothetical protein
VHQRAAEQAEPAVPVELAELVEPVVAAALAEPSTSRWTKIVTA